MNPIFCHDDVYFKRKQSAVLAQRENLGNNKNKLGVFAILALGKSLMITCCAGES